MQQILDGSVVALLYARNMLHDSAKNLYDNSCYIFERDVYKIDILIASQVGSFLAAFA